MKAPAIVASIIAIALVGWLVLRPHGVSPVTNTEESPTTSAPHESINPGATPPPTSSGTPGSTTSYTMAQVSTHNSAQSCWSAIGGKVYDLTSWINRHPGGAAAILSLCGTDGTAKFNAQHGGQARPEQELATFYIGAVAR